MYVMYSSVEKKKKQEQKVIKISKFISLQRSPAFWGSSQDGGRRCYSRQNADLSLSWDLRQPCLWKWEWCRSGHIQRGHSQIHLLLSASLGPKASSQGLQRSAAKTETAHPQLAGLCLSYIVFFWKPSKLIPISHFLAHLVGFSWYIMILWFSIFPLSDLECILPRGWFPLITKVSDKGGCWNHLFYYQAQYYIGHPHLVGDKDSMTVCQNPSRFHFRQGCQDN